MNELAHEFVRKNKISWKISDPELRTQLSSWYSLKSALSGSLPMDFESLFNEVKNSIANRFPLIDVGEQDLLASGVPQRYAGLTLGNLSGLELIETEYQISFRIWPFLQSEPAFDPDRTNLAIWGPTGTGKTHLATGILRRCRESGLSVRWLSVSRWLEKLAASRSPDRDGDTPSYQSVIKEALDPEVLVLDDFMVDGLSDGGRRSIMLVISERYNDVKATVLTSNNDPQDLESFDGRLFSRFGGHGLIGLGGQDRRLAGNLVHHIS